MNLWVSILALRITLDVKLAEHGQTFAADAAGLEATDTADEL